TGSAKYEYRAEGNGVIPDGHNAFKPTATVAGSVFSLRMTVTNINTSATVVTTKSWTCPGPSACRPATVVTALTNAVNAFGTGVANLTAVGTRVLGLVPGTGYTVTVDTLTNLSAFNKNPIRRAEVRAYNSSGVLTQCGETDGTGNFSINLPNDGGTYSVRVYSRSNNSSNTAYIMDTPTANVEYSLSSSVVSTGVPAPLTLVAPATGTMTGAAFNILDQILNSQEYLRAQTLGCTADYAQCEVFTTAPLVYVYWKKGVSPGVYYGISGPISFYLNGDRQLYILGGVNGNTDVADMDHFDNSIIIHEYGHFIEDQFGNPDSPGGSHDGDSIIDPRLAWGEGWANFFQAAVTQDPYYRDTVGRLGCTPMPCTSVSFDEYLDPTGGSYLDKPTVGAVGEGNFREFSVARVLWDVIKVGGASQFSEVWTAFTGAVSMQSINDRFKSIGRLHALQLALTSADDWTTVVAAEEQRGGSKDYGNLLTTAGGCAPTTTAMAIKKNAGDEGSPDTSDQFRHNDFLIYNHPGGSATILLEWTGAAVADLDLYLYREDYVYGASTGRVAYSYAESNTTSGSESVTASLAAGKYLINVVAYTGVSAYLNGSTYNTAYSLKINGVVACPTN
ncbi:MAG: hypothetical protein V4692_03855, partial [Bdellovibrionota bacterium]